jgi:formamidopyrimidine-DNA glycosylase
MPELPEVEVVARGLRQRVLGHVVRGAQVRTAGLRWPLPPALPELVAGRRIERIERRGKYLLMHLGDGALILHLGMSGSLRFLEHWSPPQRHDHVDIELAGGWLRLHDPRRFGALLWHGAGDGPLAAHPLLARLGVEPLGGSFDGGVLHRGTRGRRVAIKQLLLAGQVVVGVGNIYASESLFRAGIRPTTRAARLSRERCDRLADAIRQTLAQAIERGGSTLRDFAGADGQGGYFQLECAVYGRHGEPCRACGTPVRMAHHQQRATYWCPRCQT